MDLAGRQFIVKASGIPIQGFFIIKSSHYLRVDPSRQFRRENRWKQ